MKIGKIGEWLVSETTQAMKLGTMLLKPMQMAIINCNKKHDVLVNLPTGYGKSMLYQYPASSLQQKCIIVFVPLRALLWDSIKEANMMNIIAKQAQDQTINKYFVYGDLPQILLLTPEKLAMNRSTMGFIETLHERNQIDKFVIDEAHCISDWGSDFRPSYLLLTQLRQLFPGPRILAMSATIPLEARLDLVNKTGINSCYYFQASFNRSNLYYQVLKTQKKDIVSQIQAFLNKNNLQKDSGIIYCQTIKLAEELYKMIRLIEPSSELFHSKITEKKRQLIYLKFKQGSLRLMIATVCFGMGINKPDVRFVIHVGISSSVQNYYQQSGRAGRDGLKAYCLLLTFNGDENALLYLTQVSKCQLAVKSRKIYKINQVKQFTESLECRRVDLFRRLGEEFQAKQCHNFCDYCCGSKQETEQVDFTEKGLFIIKHLAKKKKFFTKIQIANYLKGSNIQKKKMEYAEELKGYLKKDTMEDINLLIDVLAGKGLLVSKVCTGKFPRRYLKPANLSFIKNVKQIKLKRIVEKKNVKGKGKDKFDLYTDKKLQIPKLENKSFNSKNNTQLQCQDLKQAKIISIDNEMEQFFQELFRDDPLMHTNTLTDQQQQKFNSEKQKQNQNYLEEVYDQMPEPLYIQEAQTREQPLKKQFYLNKQSQKNIELIKPIKRGTILEIDQQEQKKKQKRLQKIIQKRDFL